MHTRHRIHPQINIMASLTLLLSSRLLTSLFLCLLMAAFWSTTLAFVPPCCHSSSGRRQVKATTTRMMAERFYSKWSRADFVLKSALAAAAVIPVIKGGTMARDAQATERVVLPVKNGKLATDEDEEKDSPLAFSSAKGVPLRFPLHKSQEQALSELQEVVVRIGGRLSKARGGSRSDVLRAAFQSNDDDLYFRFGGDGGSSGYSSVLQASVGRDVDNMRLMNALADGLASKGWLAAGFPLSCDPAMGQYYSQEFKCTV